MEKELEGERERDKARMTRFLEPRFNISEPPPKVAVKPHIMFFITLIQSCTFLMTSYHYTVTNSYCLHLQPSRINTGRFGNTLGVGLHLQVCVSMHLQNNCFCIHSKKRMVNDLTKKLFLLKNQVLLYRIILVVVYWFTLTGMCAVVFYFQLNEALCASSPDLASPCDYQSPIDSTNSLSIPKASPRRLSLGVKFDHCNAITKSHALLFI